ncbi:YkgJ family cysteine cluster protein [uncultured Pseudomonas sp.]|nr:YkgJ family cysteine cluster protein [uncultured Pseudomonas sp.]
MAQILRILGADLDRTETWIRYDKAMCLDCVSSCCTLPVEARLSDLIRMGVVDEFEKGEPLKDIAKRLKKDGVVERLNAKTGLFTLVRLSNNDCVYLHPKTRLCTIYDQRPETCRNHPRVGPRPGYCA